METEEKKRLARLGALGTMGALSGHAIHKGLQKYPRTAAFSLPLLGALAAVGTIGKDDLLKKEGANLSSVKNLVNKGVEGLKKLKDKGQKMYASAKDTVGAIPETLRNVRDASAHGKASTKNIEETTKNIKDTSKYLKWGGGLAGGGLAAMGVGSLMKAPAEYQRRKYYKRLNEELDKKGAEKIPGGRADGLKPSQFDEKQLREGIKVEKEHTGSSGKAREIVMDHIVEAKKKNSEGKYVSPYYKKLHKLEKSI